MTRALDIIGTALIIGLALGLFAFIAALAIVGLA